MGRGVYVGVGMAVCLRVCVCVCVRECVRVERKTGSAGCTPLSVPCPRLCRIGMPSSILIYSHAHTTTLIHIGTIHGIMHTNRPTHRAAGPQQRQLLGSASGTSTQ